jgi:hypothetical protein
MVILLRQLCIIIFFSIFFQNSASAETSENKKINQLEKRIAELETIVQLLLKKTEEQASSTLNHQQKNPPNKIINNQQLVNQQNIAKNSKSLEKVTEISEQAEIAMYSYEQLSEEINNTIKLSGYADVEYKGSSESGINEEFRMHHLSLFVTKKFENDLKFFSEIEYEDAPKFEGVNDGSGDLDESSGKIFVEALNFDWNYSQYLNMRVGRFFAPAGIWSEDHYPPFVTTQERPLHIRKIFPQLVDGISLFGSVELSSNHFLDYTTFLGNGESNVSGKKDLNSSKSVGLKGDYHAPWLDEFTLGFTLYRDNNDSSNNNAEKFAYGYHFKLRYNNFTLQSEYAQANLDYKNSLYNYKSKGYYTQLLYNFDQWGIGFRYDVLDKTNVDIESIQRNSIFINYHLNEHFTLKGEYHDDSHDDPLIDDYGYYIFSVTGYLGN